MIRNSFTTKSFFGRQKISLALLILAVGFCSRIWSNDSLSIREFEEAKITNHHILLIFSGSDWCRPCIRFQEEVLEDPAFLEFKKERIILLSADFPQRKKLDPDIVRQNEYLADKYNSNGNFPWIVLITPDLKNAIPLEFKDLNTELFILQLKERMKAYSHRIYEKEAILMGSAFMLSIVDSISSTKADQLLSTGVKEIQRIEHLISEWIDTTQLSRLNQSAGISALRVDPELYELIRRSKRISTLTQGAFDISFLGLSGLWQFNKQEARIPDQSKINESLNTVGFQNIQLLDSNQVFLKKSNMAIGFGGIGKGYAADQVKNILIKQGIEDGVVNAGGDLIAWGKPPDDDFWKIAIANPANPSEIFCWLPVKNMAVATSGDYEKYLLINGVRYAHIIDPKTGFPTKDIVSATVISHSAELSDALATAIFVLGIKTGLDMINQLPNVECLIIDQKMKIHTSNHLEMINP